MDRDLSAPATIVGWLVGLPVLVWTTWTGVQFFTGGTVPLLGWTVEQSAFWGVAWFVAGEYLVFMALVAPVVIVVELLVRAIRAAARGGGSGADPGYR